MRRGLLRRGTGGGGGLIDYPNTGVELVECVELLAETENQEQVERALQQLEQERATRHAEWVATPEGATRYAEWVAQRGAEVVPMSRRQLPPQIKKIEVTDRKTGKLVVRYEVTVDLGLALRRVSGSRFADGTQRSSKRGRRSLRSRTVSPLAHSSAGPRSRSSGPAPSGWPGGTVSGRPLGRLMSTRLRCCVSGTVTCRCRSSPRAILTSSSLTWSPERSPASAGSGRRSRSIRC